MQVGLLVSPPSHNGAVTRENEIPEDDFELDAHKVDAELEPSVRHDSPHVGVVPRGGRWSRSIDTIISLAEARRKATGGIVGCGCGRLRKERSTSVRSSLS